jgi:hypothetical protein
MSELSQPTQAFVELSADYANSVGLSLVEYVQYLGRFQGLAPNEVLFSFATRLLSHQEHDSACGILKTLANDHSLIGSFSTTLLQNLSDVE